MCKPPVLERLVLCLKILVYWPYLKKIDVKKGFGNYVGCNEFLRKSWKIAAPFHYTECFELDLEIDKNHE